MPITKAPVEQTPAAVQAANEAIDFMVAEINRRVTSHDDIRRFVYANPYGVTPAEIFASWGTNAKAIFLAAAANAADIRAQAANFGLDPDAVFPASAYTPPILVTIHEDGTVTTP